MDDNTASKIIAKILAGAVRVTFVLEKDLKVISGIATGVSNERVEMIEARTGRGWRIPPRLCIQATVEGEMFP